MISDKVDHPCLVVGLGNPGRDHKYNRHNVGFMLLDRIAERLGLGFTRLQFKALVADTRYQDRRLILAKPQTYMNRAGDSVGTLVRFFKIPPQHVLVIYDDLDLPLGVIRLRPAGGAGGHNGMRSIISSLGRDDFPRLRMGIDRPSGRMDAAEYVLQDFTEAEVEMMTQTLERAVECVFTLLTDGIEQTMTKFNRDSNG